MAEFPGKDLGDEDILALLREKGVAVLEARLINRGAVRVRAGEDYQPSLFGALHAPQEGWSFDQVARCWRAPGESVTDPGGEPEPVTAVVAKLEKPRAGWMHLILMAGSGKTVVSMSDVYDPVPDLLRWLEDLTDGGLPPSHDRRGGSWARTPNIAGTIPRTCG
jgi:hypothetical protein